MKSNAVTRIMYHVFNQGESPNFAFSIHQLSELIKFCSPEIIRKPKDVW